MYLDELRAETLGFLTSYLDDLSANCPKTLIREKLRTAVESLRARARAKYGQYEDLLLSYLASGNQVTPESIRPQIRLVAPGTIEHMLFQYARLHWSIPTSNGYGRRCRFVVLDENNGKLIGLIALGDPVFALAPRDNWIGWDRETKKRLLSYVAEIFILGAVPPYSYLLGGKLVALLATSREVQESFEQKYRGKNTRISQRPQTGQLALMTTFSGLGRSSIYNRIRYRGQPVYISLGFTQGAGDRHIPEDLYEKLRSLVRDSGIVPRKNKSWSTGFRNRRAIIQAASQLLDVPVDLFCSRIQREIYVIPLGAKSREFLRGQTCDIEPWQWTAQELSDYWRERWGCRRARERPEFREFEPETWRLWPRRTLF